MKTNLIGGNLKKIKPRRKNWEKQNLFFSNEFECEVDLLKEKPTLNSSKKI